jgi:hypothetical protein
MAPSSCSGCGAAVKPATSLMSEGGLLCATCFGRWEREQQVARQVENVKHLAFLGRASTLARLHGANWAIAFILFAGWVPIPGWLSGGLILGVLVLAFAMGLRSNLAFRIALALDTVGAIGFGVGSVLMVRDGRLLFLLFPVVFGWWLAFITWRAREVFVERGIDGGLR